MQSIPYQYRLLILFLLMGLAVGVDYWRNPKRPTKLQEYLFLIVAGFTGAGFGIVNDQITCTLSPAYFYYFKNIPYSSSFRWQVSEVGFEAGFFAGFFSYGIFLLVNQRRKLPLSRSVESRHKTSYLIRQVPPVGNRSSNALRSSDDSIPIANNGTCLTIDVHKMLEFPSTPKSHMQLIPCRSASSHR